MRTILSTLFLSFILMGATAQKMRIKEVAQDQKQEVFNYIVMTKNIDQLEPILMAATQLMKQDEKGFGNFEIIVYGKDIGEITDAKKMERYIKEASDLKINILACELSLKKSDINPEKLPDNVKTVENAFFYNLQLQRKGYLSLEL